MTGDRKIRARVRPFGSLRRHLLLWLLLPLTALAIINAVSDYGNALEAVDLAYDRTLLASSRAIAERILVVGDKITVKVPYVALDIFGADVPGRIFYKVSGINGEFISGFDDFPRMPHGVPRSEIYPALAHFYSETYRGEPLRVVALFQPVYEGSVRGMVLIQVGETLEARQLLARKIVREAIGSQIALLLAVVLLTGFAVRFALRSLGRLAREVERRSPTDLAEFDPRLVHKEVRPLVIAMNNYTDRLQRLIDAQRRFTADASHQLRTPLAVLKTQAELVLRRDIPPDVREVLTSLRATLNRAVRLANQLLSRARMERRAIARSFAAVDLKEIAQQVCIEMAEAAIDKPIDLSFDSPPMALVFGDPLMLRELITNLVDNALRYTPEGGRVLIRLTAEEDAVLIEVEDSGPGIPLAERERVFEPFYRGTDSGYAVSQYGSGLGLAIVREIASAHRATIGLEDSPLGGLRVVVRFATDRRNPAG